MDKQFLFQILASAFAAVGIEEYIKNFFKPKNKKWYAAMMIPLSIGSFCAAYLLPLYVIGSLLVIGSVQLCYQGIIQGFKSIIESLTKKITKE